jgi:xylulokinase
LGSAFLAALGTGGAKTYEDIAGWAAIASTTRPDPAARQRYDRLYPVYQGLYPKLKPDFDVLGNH